MRHLAGKIKPAPALRRQRGRAHGRHRRGRGGGGRRPAQEADSPGRGRSCGSAAPLSVGPVLPLRPASSAAHLRRCARRPARHITIPAERRRDRLHGRPHPRLVSHEPPTGCRCAQAAPRAPAAGGSGSCLLNDGYGAEPGSGCGRVRGWLRQPGCRQHRPAGGRQGLRAEADLQGPPAPVPAAAAAPVPLLQGQRRQAEVTDLRCQPALRRPGPQRPRGRGRRWSHPPAGGGRPWNRDG